MQRFNRVLSLALIFCMLVSILTPTQVVRAAETVQRYELDTDGIDPGATYLIVNTGTAGSGNALKFYYSGWFNRDFRNQTLTVTNEDGIRYIASGFSGETDCQFQFSAANTGSIVHGDYKVDLGDGGFANWSSTNALTFTNVGNGQYRIQCTSWGNTYYLCYNNNDWIRSETSSTVYLYKLVERELSYDVTYHGNGNTSGTLPGNATNIESGKTYTVVDPTDLRKDVDEDTWLFQCWNTKSDGSGDEYKPGDIITVTGDVHLYAQWYQQTKYKVELITYLDGVPTDADKINAVNGLEFFAKLEGGDGTYIPLTRKADGTYSNKVVDNGTYVVYYKTADSDYEMLHEHKVVIYNQDGKTECMSYSVTYNANGGNWNSGEEPSVTKYHANTAVTAVTNVPTSKGNRFLGWKDQDENMIAPGGQITAGINKPTTLTAQWEKTITVTVNVVIDHNAKTTGEDNDASKHDILFNLLREENGVNLPIEEKVLTTGYVYNATKNTTTYQVVFEDMPQGIYNAASTKSSYEGPIERSGAANENQTINISMQYAPDNFDLTFDVVVNTDPVAEKELMPQAVNVKVSYWGYNSENELGWHIITQQDGDKAPTTVTIGEDGKGSGYFPVWRYWSGSDNAYEYRVEVTSFIMPDGSVAPATGNDKITYMADGSGLYTAAVSIVDGGRTPEYPDGSSTELSGAYFNGDKQIGKPVVTLDITPFTVTFDAGAGTVNGGSRVELANQYKYPDLTTYTAVPSEEGKTFICWLENEEPAANKAGQFLTGNVVYTARYNDNITISGNVTIDATYEQDGQTVYINDIDRAEEVLVVLQKKVGDVYNDVEACETKITYGNNATTGTGSYEFTNVPNDGSEYRVQVLVLNYTGLYNNDTNQEFTEEEAIVPVDVLQATGEVDIHLTFHPDSYQQAVKLDASQIHEDFRPTGALSQILYRDLGDVHNYNVISQHSVDPFGIQIEMNSEKTVGMGFDDIWNWHTEGALYEYQMQVSKLYGDADIYGEGGAAYTNASPYTIHYGPSNNYIKQTADGGVMLQATMVPKEYPIYLDLNLGSDSTPVSGLEAYMIDSGSGSEQYAYIHKWSYSDEFVAFPYREGYAFKGWESTAGSEVYIRPDGTINVGATLANAVTLTAKWEKLAGTDYTVRHLELNTDKVLDGDEIVTGTSEGTVVSAHNCAHAIDGYVYAGAWTNGIYLEKDDNPEMIVTTNPRQNVMVIYYLPDGSDGYTEQVESNLEINKTAVLEDDGTYTITMDIFTRDNPITTRIQQNTPLDIVMVLDQSGSLAENNFEYLNALQSALDEFVTAVADHGRRNEVDHRIAMVGYAGNSSDAHSSDPVKATGGKETDSWINTGVFDSNGEFHLYNVKGFNYTELNNTNNMTVDGVYYVKVGDEYLLLTHYDEYRHLIDEIEAREALLLGEKVYGYAYNEQNVGGFVELTRNSSGLWLYGNNKLYSAKEFFTYHTDVWTYRNDVDNRQIHAYGVGSNYQPIDGQNNKVYTRTETTGNSYDQSIYKDALIPVSIGANGSGGTNPGLLRATEGLGADGATRSSYGMEMANAILAANPLNADEGRLRMVVMFTDGEPGYMGFDSSSGQSYYDQAVTEANDAIAQAYISKNTHHAYVYSIGLYKSGGIDATSEVAYYMNALSSNYLEAKDMDDIKETVKYVLASNGTPLESNGKFFIQYNNNYYEIKYGYVRTSGNYNQRYCWYWTYGSTNYAITTKTNPTVSPEGKVDNYTYSVYQANGGYKNPDQQGYYATTESPEQLEGYFEQVLRDITTKITTEIVLHNDTILRDIMNQGLVLTDGTVITAYTQYGKYNATSGEIDWAIDANGKPVLEEKVSLTIGSGATTATDSGTGLSIQVYNLNATNPTDPTLDNYAPHTVDVTGFRYDDWYISGEDGHTEGYKVVVTINRVEAMDDVEWSRSTATNYETSGLWLPADANGKRELLLPFDQPTTIFVERAYVLDYGKEFTLTDWYFDDGGEGKEAIPIHIDCDIDNGMNWFDPKDPAKSNGIENYGNTKYGNVRIQGKKVIYSPVSMNWKDYDQFYVFGNTWRNTVRSQDANENGNLWSKVTVIPANNIYYEDSFITTEDSTVNGIDGFEFTGEWTISTGENAGTNTEVPERQETGQYGKVHGWVDSLNNEQNYTDRSAHETSTPGAKASFTFTGTGVDVYTRTNAQSGMVVAVLEQIADDASKKITKSIAIDNLAMSGDYYHIPTVSFEELPYGTYQVTLYATNTSTATGYSRYEYCIDGVRIYNPLGGETNYLSDTVKDAYGLETNAVFTEVRDVLLDYGDFNAEMDDSTDGKMGAVFIDWIQEGQGTGNDSIGTGLPTYELGTFESLGPKNEVYLTTGQAIVLKVDEDNNYFVGLKSLTGEEIKVNVSGKDLADPTSIRLSHTTDLYYQVTPVGGYIVIQNGNTDDAVLSITKLRTTNLDQPDEDGGILPVTPKKAVQLMSEFTEYLQEKEEEEALMPPEEEEEVTTVSAIAQAEENLQMTNALFRTVRKWLKTS